MNDKPKDLVGFALACAAFWSVFIGIAMHSIGWLAFSATCAAISVAVWSE